MILGISKLLNKSKIVTSVFSYIGKNSLHIMAMPLGIHWLYENAVSIIKKQTKNIKQISNLQLLKVIDKINGSKLFII